MIETLVENYNDLKEIRKYLVKKGKSRYVGKTIEIKLGEAKNIFDKCSELFLLLKSKQDIKVISSASDIFKNIKELYEDINNLCMDPNIEIVKMEFDLKTACNLLPVMDGTENVTKRLIDGIEMYSEMINASDNDLLIKFVLKNRITENAKLRLAGTYKSISELVKDMRTHLITKKSFTAIQSRLQNISQGFRSIDEYGTELEQLFTDLTISQADGESTKYNVLKPINEKFAIRKFADGLKSSRLSTIIAARNYNSLKDAIQAAKDEDCLISSGSGDVMHFTNKSNNRGQRGNYANHSRYQQGHGGRGTQGRGQSSNRYVRGQYYSKYYNFRGNHNSRGNYNHRGSQQSYRGRNFRNNNNYRGNNRRIYSAQVTESTNNSGQETEQKDQSKFFRESK